MPKRMEIAGRLSTFAWDKWEKGREEHGTTFQGDPVEHAMEEIPDLWFYLSVIRSKIDSLAGISKEHMAKVVDGLRTIHPVGAQESERLNQIIDALEKYTI